MPRQGKKYEAVPKVDPVEVAINELIKDNNHILIVKNNILKQQIIDFNQNILNIHEKEIDICDYITLFKEQLITDVDLTYMSYFLKLHQEPTFINADELGPQRFKVLSLESNKRSLTTKQLQSIMDQYDFKENEDYFKRGDVPPLGAKTPRTVYVISPYVLKTCLTGSKAMGRIYRQYYFFLELSIHAYSKYQFMYTLEDRKDTIKRLEESNHRLEESNHRIEAKLDIAVDSLDILTDLHNEINITENIITPPGDTELHTQFAVFKSNSPETVLYDRKYHSHKIYTVYRTQKSRLDKEEKKLCVRKSTHKCIIKIDVHSSMYIWNNIKKNDIIDPLIRLIGSNTFVLRKDVCDNDLIEVFINIAKENNLNVINTLSDLSTISDCSI